MITQVPPCTNMIFWHALTHCLFSGNLLVAYAWVSQVQCHLGFSFSRMAVSLRPILHLTVDLEFLRSHTCHLKPLKFSTCASRSTTKFVSRKNTWRNQFANHKSMDLWCFSSTQLPHAFPYATMILLSLYALKCSSTHYHFLLQVFLCTALRPPFAAPDLFCSFFLPTSCFDHHEYEEIC